MTKSGAAPCPGEFADVETRPLKIAALISTASAKPTIAVRGKRRRGWLVFGSAPYPAVAKVAHRTRSYAL